MYFDHFKIKEIFNNCSDSEILACLKQNLCEGLFCLVTFLDSFREYIESPIVITSSYRDFDHNKRVSGSSTSQHMLGQAIDFKTPCMPISTTLYFFKEFIQKSALERFIGQVIIYDTFIHIGLRTQSHKTLQIYDKRKCKDPH